MAASRRADEYRPSLPVAETRANDLGPHPRIHVGIFVEHDAVEIEAAQGVRIIRPVKPDLAAVGIVGAQLGFIHRGPGLAQERHGIAQVIPRHGLGLFEERREIGKPRVLSASCSLRASTHSASRLAMEGSTLTAWRRSSQTISGEHIKNSIKLFLTTPIA